MDISLINPQNQESLSASASASINAYDGTRPKRPIRGQQHQHHQSNAPSPSSYDQNKAIANIQRQVDGLAKQFTQLMARETNRQNAPPSSAPPPRFPNSRGGSKPQFFPNPLEYTMDGRPICAYCKNPGHLKRDCRKKAAADLRRPSGNQ